MYRCQRRLGVLNKRYVVELHGHDESSLFGTDGKLNRVEAYRLSGSHRLLASYEHINQAPVVAHS
jgi:hypothetical protein